MKNWMLRLTASTARSRPASRGKPGENRAAGGGLPPVGLRPPFVSPPPGARLILIVAGVLILIVARQRCGQAACWAVWLSRAVFQFQGSRASIWCTG